MLGNLVLSFFTHDMKFEFVSHALVLFLLAFV